MMSDADQPPPGNPNEVQGTAPAAEPAAVPGPTINIGQEFGTASKTLPPAATIAITLFVVVLAGIAFAYFQRATPRASGSIVSVSSAQVPNDNLVIAAIAVHIQNTSSKRLWIKTIRAELQAASGDQSSDAISSADFQRFLGVFPDLKRDAYPPLSPEDAFQPGDSATRTVLVAFHTSAQDFSQRKSLSVVLLPYDEHVEIVLR